MQRGHLKVLKLKHIVKKGNMHTISKNWRFTELLCVIWSLVYGPFTKRFLEQIPNRYWKYITGMYTKTHKGDVARLADTHTLFYSSNGGAKKHVAGTHLASKCLGSEQTSFEPLALLSTLYHFCKRTESLCWEHSHSVCCLFYVIQTIATTF